MSAAPTTTEQNPERPVSRHRRYLNLREFFRRGQHLAYAIIDNYEKLPIEANHHIAVLTDNMKALVVTWSLTLMEDNLYRTAEELPNGKPLLIRIYQKGKRVFPDSFETQILNRAVLHNECVKVPDMETFFLVRMYWRTFYEGMLSGDNDRGIMIEFLRRRVGEPITPKYKHLALNKTKQGIR